MDGIEENPGLLIIGAIVIFAFLFGLGILLGAVKCGNMGSVMGLKSDYGILQGCIIETKKGDRVPLKNYRYMED